MNLQQRIIQYKVDVANLFREKSNKLNGLYVFKLHQCNVINADKYDEFKELLDVSRDGKVTSRGTLSTEPSSCKCQPRRKVYTVKPL